MARHQKPTRNHVRRTFPYVLKQRQGTKFYTVSLQAFNSATLVAAGVGVGICSSVIPYISDQLAMSRLPRSSFALFLALLPATATVIAAIILAQIPSPQDIVGVALVMIGITLHKQPGSAVDPENTNREAA